MEHITTMSANIIDKYNGDRYGVAIPHRSEPFIFDFRAWDEEDDVIISSLDDCNRVITCDSFEELLRAVNEYAGHQQHKVRALADQIKMYELVAWQPWKR